MPRAVPLAAALALLAALPSCKPAPRPLAPRTQTFAELRAIRRGVTVLPPGDAERAPYARERLVDGERVKLADGALAWLRRDGGETLLVAGPGELEVTKDDVAIASGKVFVEAEASAGSAVGLRTPRGPLRLSGVRASLEVAPGGEARAYVLRGAVRGPDGATAGPGEALSLEPQGASRVSPVLAWDDWTGGLATTDQSSQPAPYGVGTVGARTPGAQGQPRFPLAIQKLEVRVKIDHDFALTEVEEVFFNPSAETVEGIYSFRTPPGAALHRFGVDRDGDLVWGRVKEKQAAAAQYQSHVYVGSTEDPALLEWDSPGVYRARLYPIPPGSTRRLVATYGEWLGRQGPKGERRLYVYPMAAEGAQGSVPSIEELSIAVDLGKAGAREVRSGMEGAREGTRLLVRAHDLRPKADFALELFDDGAPVVTAYQAPHRPDLDVLPVEEREKAVNDAQGEADYVLVPVRAPRPPEAQGGIDLAIVVDASAATQPSSLAVARSLTQGLLAHMGRGDRAAVWAGDASLRPVAEGSGSLSPVDPARRQAIVEGLARIERGGATDLAAVVAEAARSLDPARRGAVVYVGDGRPTVGEIAVGDIRARLDRLPRPVRLFAVGTGDEADMAVLKGIARGAFAERVGDGHAAAGAALRLLEEAERPVWLGAEIDLGLGVERVYPRELSAVEEGETVLMVGRVAGALPGKVTVKLPHGSTSSSQVVTMPVDDDGDLRRRWAEGRLVQLLDEGAGRAAVVEVGARFGIVTPFTSLYVPTTAEAAQERARAKAAELRAQAERQRSGEGDSWSPFSRSKSDRASVVSATASAAAQAEVAKQDAAEVEAKVKALTEDLKNAKDESTRRELMGKLEESRPRAKAAGGAMRKGKGAAPGDPLAGVDFESDDIPAQGAPRGGSASTPAMEPPASPPPPAPPWMVNRRPAPAAAPPPRTTAPAATATAAPGPAVAGKKAYPGGSTHSFFGTGHEPGQPSDGELAKQLAILDSSVLGALGSVGGGKSAQAARPVVAQAAVEAGVITHRISLCGAGASLPLEERKALWRERLAATGQSVAAVRQVYQTALGWCEAPTGRERSALLYMMLDALPRVTQRVELWRLMFADRFAADLLYPAIILRLRTPEEVREFHGAVGLRRVDPGVLDKTLREAKTPAERVKKLLGLIEVWPHDLDLAVRLLEEHQDQGDEGAGRAWARRLRRRGDADARVRTAVGEYFLWLSRKKGPGMAADEAEARRTFGEIVEFAPDDPIARRRLGDLCLAHGWFDEAFRHYETLSRLAPHDVTVPLLLAQAAQGTGRVEEAIRWTERAARASAPEAASGGGRVARAFGRAFLAWAQLDAQAAQQADEARALAQRARTLGALDVPAGHAITRVVLTWSHPDLHPVLWSNALGGMLPAPDGDPLLGVAQAMLPPGSTGGRVEIGLEPDDAARAARLRAQAELTAVFDEGSDHERVVRLPVRFERPDAVVLAFKVGDGAIVP